MNDEHLNSVAGLTAFTKAADKVVFENVGSIKEKYIWVEAILTRFRYFSINKKAKSEVRKYITMVTEYSPSQLSRLIKKKKKTGRVRRSEIPRNRFEKRYTVTDIELLLKTDNAHGRISGPATKKVLEREYSVFRKIEYENVKRISPSHIYNLRQTRQYTSQALTFVKTDPVDRNIGERRKPRPDGKPGFLRVDSVHQGDRGGEKGVYHINIVDEVTQSEWAGCVETISEFHLRPLLLKLLTQIPFRIWNFHSDNGSEYINYVVAKILNDLLIDQTKSRSRHSNDNALAEGKNGSRIRKYMGYWYIPKKFAGSVDLFYQTYFNIYLNYHRPCGFATTTTDNRGKEKKKYDIYMTAYEKFKSLPNAEQYLKEGITFEMLDKIAYEFSDNEWAEKMQKGKVKLFESFRR
jgi:DNA-binding MarR family transcriptional regulator